jgi:hypothetical protein
MGTLATGCGERTDWNGWFEEPKDGELSKHITLFASKV